MPQRGRAGTACPYRSADSAISVFLPIIREWSARTETGDRAELADLPEDVPVWNDVSATAETCLGTECPRYDDCFVTRMRQRAAASDVVIVNHHLLCADAAVRQSAFGEVIPACAERDRRRGAPAGRCRDAVFRLQRQQLPARGSGARCRTPDGRRRDRRRRATDEHRESRRRSARSAPRAFFTELAFAHRSTDRVRGEERVRATSSSLARDGRHRRAADRRARSSSKRALGRACRRRLEADGEGGSAQASPRRLSRTDDDATTGTEAVATLVRRAGELRDEIRLLLRAGDSDYVYFVEFRGRGIFLRAAPVDVSAIVRELLLDRMRTTVLTSATLTVDGTFEYIRKRLGIKNAAEICLPSEFDFARQALMYLPPRMPDPRSADFSIAAGREVVEILKRTRGRAFVLFTSYATMRDVLGIAEMALDYPIFAQGSAPRTQLLKQFRETPHAVLFATSSFWQGVDVVGEALSCVIIDKLPFTSPADPVTAARIDAIRERGGDPFGEYQVPLAILALQQGLGRLIRHRQDRGVLAVLDPRLRTKGYGRRFIASLPPGAAGAEFRGDRGLFLRLNSTA